MKRLIYAFIIVLMLLSGCSNTTQTKEEATNEGKSKTTNCHHFLSYVLFYAKSSWKLS